MCPLESLRVPQEWVIPGVKAAHLAQNHRGGSRPCTQTSLVSVSENLPSTSQGKPQLLCCSKDCQLLPGSSHSLRGNFFRRKDSITLSMPFGMDPAHLWPPGALLTVGGQTQAFVESSLHHCAAPGRGGCPGVCPQRPARGGFNSRMPLHCLFIPHVYNYSCYYHQQS